MDVYGFGVKMLERKGFCWFGAGLWGVEAALRNWAYGLSFVLRGAHMGLVERFKRRQWE